MSEGSARQPPRIGSLDRLRAAAVLMIIAYHVVQMAPSPVSGLARITSYGRYGVDLFFVLSGWLIGGLYWREMSRFGNVDYLRFWQRRWTRTLPPYVVALAASWLAVRMARQEPFDWGYLLFLQNYYAKVPYFLVSWSLCVEEHFYIVAPLFSGILATLASLTARRWMWLAAFLISPVMRALDPAAQSEDGFGYATTATHLCLDGLTLGFALAYLASYEAPLLERLRGWAPGISAGGLVAFALLELTGGAPRHVLGPTAAAICFGAILVWGLPRRSSGSTSRRGIADRALTAIALASYSAYLVHPLVIHMARTATGRWPLLYWPLVAALIAVASSAFYVLVERSSITLRDRMFPPRARKSPARESARLPAS